MSLYKRGKTWWFTFRFAGQKIYESAKTHSKTVARDAERARRRELEDGYNGLSRSERAIQFSIVAERWLTAKVAHLSPKSTAIEKCNLKHLLPMFGKLLLCDITADSIAAYQARRLKEKASPRTVNLELGTIRGILRKHRLWAGIQPDIRMLPTDDAVGRAISTEEEKALLAACGESRSRSLLPAVTIALSTAMRASEIRLLRWSQVDFTRQTITVGKSKTAAGTGRTIPLNGRAVNVLRFWAGQFPERKPEHYVFPSEKYGGAGEEDAFGFRGAVPYETDPEKPIGHWKEAWEAAKVRAGITLYGKLKDGERARPLVCRFHDLRHTACTRMLEAGVPFSVVATIMGWSTATTIRMTRIYGHIGQAAQREAVQALAGAEISLGYLQKSLQSEGGKEPLPS
ncbi:MAG: site-specific integrase [Acidobacteria bacterium]|nr:site-specific integrase [Acidobacteriota bacterium]